LDIYKVSLTRWIFRDLGCFILFGFFEIASRVGPKKFDTPVSFFLSLGGKDRIIVLLAFCLSFGFTVLTKNKVQLLDFETKLIYAGISIILLIMPIILFGSQDLRRLFRKQNEQSN
jgi:hypothetical protein